MILLMKIKQRLYWFLRIGYRYFLSKTKFAGSINANINIHNSVVIKNSFIGISEGSSLMIEEGTVINNLSLFIDGNVKIGKNNIINNESLPGKITINVNNGFFELGCNNKIQSIIKIRFGGHLYIGEFNNINIGSEIRVDEYVRLGDFNQISYKVNIWDTNTHNIYKADKRRELTINKFPVFGYEFEKPKTKPITIGNDCWIGREATLLKGVNLSNKCIVGYKTVLLNCTVNEGVSVVPDVTNKFFDNKV
jgi:acetyltransferase-like isoleucine patch superfamily enzyme